MFKLRDWLFLKGECQCDIITYQVFDPSYWHGAPKILAIS